MAQGDRILGLDERGLLYLIAANKERFEIMDERKLPNAETWAHIAVAGDQVFIRDLGALTAYRWKKVNPPATAQAGTAK